MSNNLFKSCYVQRNEQAPRVIDTNDIIEQKLERIRFVLSNADETMPGQEFMGGLNADRLDIPAGDFEDDSEESQSNVIKAEPQEPVYEGPSPQELVEQANQEIEQMRQNAVRQLQEEKEATLQEAEQSGYEEGLARGRAEADKLKEALEEEKKHLEEEYESRIDELEPQFVRVLTDIYEKIFEIDLSGNRELILALLRNSMKKIEGCKNFLVHVSRNDYPFVKEHKESLLSDATQEGTTIDVIEDVSLKENECMIETPGGIFDCGLGTQLSELKKRLMLLSYESKNKG